jgi:O-antigen ligase
MLVPGLDVLVNADPIIAAIPLSFWSFLVLVGIYTVVRWQHRARWIRTGPTIMMTFFVWIGFVTVLVFGVTSSSSEHVVRTFQFAAGPVLLFLSGYVIQRDADAPALLTWLWALISIGAVGLVSLNLDAVRDGSVRALAEVGGDRADPIGIGRLMGVGAVISVIYVLRGRRLLARAAALIVAVLLVGLAILANARGPLMALIVIAGGAMLFGIVERRRWAAGALVLAITGLGAYEAYSRLDPNFNRYAATIQGFAEESRWDLFATALRMATESPLVGYGYGGFDAATGMGYPHNLFLEALTESGLVGLVLLTIAILIACRDAWRARDRDFVSESTFWLLLYYLIAAQVSGSFYGNSMLFLLAGLAYARRQTTPNASRHIWRRTQGRNPPTDNERMPTPMRRATGSGRRSLIRNEPFKAS